MFEYLRASQRFFQRVRRHVIGGTVAQRNVSEADDVARKVVLNIHMFAALAARLVSSKRDGPLVVHFEKDFRRRRKVMQRHDDASKTKGFLYSMERGDVLSLERRCGYNSLIFRTPTYGTPGKQESLPTSRFPIRVASFPIGL